MTGDLVERLRQRLTDLEAIAGAAPDCLNREEWPFWVDVDDDGEHEAAKAWRDAFSPAVVLRTIQAHRKILNEFDRVRGASNEALDRGQNDLVIALRAKEVALEVAVDALASIYFPEETES